MTGSAAKDFEPLKSRLRLGRRYCYKLWRKTHRLARGSSQSRIVHAWNHGFVL